MRILAANHQTEHGDPNGGARGRTEGVEGVCNHIGKKKQYQPPQIFQGLKHKPRVHRERPMALAVYVGEAGIVWHQEE